MAMAEAEIRALLLVLIGGAYFFLILPLLTFHLRRLLRGAAMAVFLGAVGVWFLAHLLIAMEVAGASELLLVSAAAMGVAILDLGRQYARQGVIGGEMGASPPSGGSPSTPPLAPLDPAGPPSPPDESKKV